MLFTVKDISLNVSWYLAFVHWRWLLASKRQHFLKQVAQGILAQSLPVVNRRVTQATQKWDKQKGCFGNVGLNQCFGHHVGSEMSCAVLAQCRTNQRKLSLIKRGQKHEFLNWKNKVKEKKSGWSCRTLRKGSKRRMLVSHRQSKPKHLYQWGLGEMPCTVNATSQVSVLQFMTRTICTVNFAARDVHSGLTRNPVFAVTTSPSW